MKDAYTILGINRNASEAEIKKAYRKLASQHHPDKGGDTAKFQEIQNAYETLTNSDKQHQNINHDGFGFHFNFNDTSDIFSHFFRNGHPFHQQQHHQQPRKNKDLRIQLSVTLASTLEDQMKTVSVQTTKNDRFNVDVRIPRGVTTGTTIKYSQMGDNFFDSLTRGDLYVIITVLADERFEVLGNSLLAQLTINCVEAMLGTEKELEGLDGKKFLIKIPPGCQHQSKFGLQGQGLYQMNYPHRGDLIANINVEILTPTDEQAAQLRAIWNTL